MPQRDELKNLIRINQRRLQLLKEQQAKQGISADPKILIEIEDIEEKLEELFSDLNALEAARSNSDDTKSEIKFWRIRDEAGRKLLGDYQQKKFLPVLGLIVAVLACVAAWLVVPPISNMFSSPTPTATSFDYQVRVQAFRTGNPIPNANVIIDVGEGIAPKDDITDSNGLARVVINASLVGKRGRLIVQAAGYKNYTQNIDLTKDTLPDIIQLEEAEPLLLASPSPQLVSLHTPIVNNTPTAPPLQCNQPNLASNPEVLKIVIANFNESVEATSSDLNAEDRLFESLARQISSNVVVCRTSQVVGTRIEAHRVGEELGAALILWGRRDASAFEVGLEVAHWELSRVVQKPPKEAESFLFQTKSLPGFITFLTNLILSEIYYFDGNVEEARKTLTVALSKDTSQELVNDNAVELASAYWFLGYLLAGPLPNPDLERALEAYEQAFALDKTLHAALLNKGKVLEALEKPDLAMEAYTQLIEANSPLAALALVNRAYLFHLQSDDEAAKADFEAAIKLDPVIGYQMRAEAHLRWWKDTENALEDLQTVIRLELDNPENYHFLGLAQLEIGQEAEAEQTYRASLPYLDEEMRAFMLEDLKFLAQDKPNLTKDIETITAILESVSIP